MKLYGLILSPYVARVRLALRVKDVDYELLPPPGGHPSSSEFRAINPVGKVPVLVTDDGLTIAESETIIDYLDETFASPPLMPSDPGLRVQVRNAIRVFDLYATPAMSRLFKQMDPATRDAGVVEGEMERLRDGLALTAHFVDDAEFAVGGAMSKADCILLPSLLLCGVAGTIFGAGDMVGEHPNLASYREKARRNRDMGTLWDETAAALAERASASR